MTWSPTLKDAELAALDDFVLIVRLELTLEALERLATEPRGVHRTGTYRAEAGQREADVATLRAELARRGYPRRATTEQLRALTYVRATERGRP
jgi:hypothetical protein